MPQDKLFPDDSAIAKIDQCWFRFLDMDELLRESYGEDYIHTMCSEGDDSITYFLVYSRFVYYVFRKIYIVKPVFEDFYTMYQGNEPIISFLKRELENLEKSAVFTINVWNSYLTGFKTVFQHLDKLLLQFKTAPYYKQILHIRSWEARRSLIQYVNEDRPEYPILPEGEFRNYGNDLFHLFFRALHIEEKYGKRIKREVFDVRCPSRPTTSESSHDDSYLLEDLRPVELESFGITKRNC